MRRCFRYCSIVSILLLLSTIVHTSFSQSVVVKGGFLTDSIRIGDQAAFYLSAHYPSRLNVLFPDSSFTFAPFEYEKKIYFATETNDTTSVDSAVYYVTTFEVDRAQALQLPVYVVNAQDCTQFMSDADTVLITQLVAQVPDSVSTDKLPLKTNTAYERVFFQFNYVVALIVGAALVLVSLIVWIFFGKRIIRHFKAKRLQKKHNQFIDAYNRIVSDLRSSFSRITTESAVSTWKKYMEYLEGRPYTKLTTREMLLMEKDETLARNLRALDNAIYGHNTTVVESLEQLKIFADQRFSKKIQEVKHGK